MSMVSSLWVVCLFSSILDPGGVEWTSACLIRYEELGLWLMLKSMVSIQSTAEDVDQDGASRSSLICMWGCGNAVC